ncbi:MAG TPA: chloride channel protein [Thermoanaerobaculia bacterium]|nr:chloride channel protein [Thermoanaerobaculia bacterium]
MPTTKLGNRTLLLMFVGAGLASGIAAVLFHAAIVASRHLMLDRAFQTTGLTRGALLIAIPTLTAAILGVIVQRFAPSALGANLARVRRAYVEDVGHLDAKTVLFTFLLTPLSLASGAPLGPEGPTVVVTSGLSVWIARVFKLPRKVLRGMIPVGTAAGIAAIFRTPITGVVFALEELFGTSSRSLLGGTLIAAVAAAVVQQITSPGSERILPATAATWHHVWELGGFTIVGICAGVMSGVALRCAAALRDRLRRRFAQVWIRFAIGGLAVGLLGVLSPTMLGVGYDTTSFLVRGGGSLLFDAEAFGSKILGFMIAASTGLLGGTFAPSLLIGASLGALVGHAGRLLFDVSLDSGAYALVGMGAYFAGTLRAPIAAVLIVVELTNDYGLIIPLMLAVALSQLISQAIAPQTLEEDQLSREGVRHAPELRDPLGRLVVKDVMTTAPVTFTGSTPIVEAIERTRDLRHQAYPVVDDHGRLAGLLFGDDIARCVRQQRLDATVEDLRQPHLIAAREDEAVRDLLDRMAATAVDRCPVVDANGTVVGFVSPSDLMRARFREQPLIGEETLR